MTPTKRANLNQKRGATPNNPRPPKHDFTMTQALMLIVMISFFSGVFGAMVAKAVNAGAM